MVQQRFINFGDTVLAQRINEISTAIVAHGVLEGGEFSLGVTNSTLRIGANKVMLNDLLLVEDTFTDISLNLDGTDPVDYTIVYEHVNQTVQGGVGAVMLAQEGLFGFEDLANTTILGWVQYPAGGVALNVNMFTEAPKLQIQNPSEFPSDIQVPPFVPKIYVQSELPTAGVITKIDQYSAVTLKASMELINTGASPTTLVQRFPFVSGVDAPNRVIVEANVELGANVKVSLISEDGTEFSLEDDEFSNTSGFFEFREMQVIEIDLDKFPQNRPYFVSLTTLLNTGRRASISLVGTSSNFLPI